MNRHTLSISAAALLTAASLGAQAHAQTTQQITITDQGCQPNDITLAAGDEIFTLINGSARALEWEILSDVQVVFERENILPGFKIDLRPKLRPGTYDMTCGLLSNPKGKLTIVAAGNSATAQSGLDPDMAKAVKDYRAYIQTQASDLAKSTAAFVEAIKAGKLDEAQRLFALTRVPYERIEPVAELFGDLDPAIDARADDFEKKEQDPTWTGFHRLEYGLFSVKSLDGLAPVADKLLVDVTELKSRIAVMDMPPSKMINGAAVLIEEIAKSKISGEEDRYSGTDLSDFQSNIEGSMKILDLIRPMLEKKDKALLDAIDAKFNKVTTILAKYRGGEGFKPYSTLSETDRNVLKGAISALAEDLAKLPGTLDLAD